MSEFTAHYIALAVAVLVGTAVGVVIWLLLTSLEHLL